MTILGGKLVFAGFPTRFFSDAFVNAVASLEVEYFLVEDGRLCDAIVAEATRCCIISALETELGGSCFERLAGLAPEEVAKRKIVRYLAVSAPEERLRVQKAADRMEGTIDLRGGPKDLFQTLVKIIGRHELRGKRKYVRVRCEPAGEASVIIDLHSGLLRAPMKDMSVIGTAVEIPPDAPIAAGSTYPAIIVLGEKAMKAEVSLLKREGTTAVLVFLAGKMDQEFVSMIHLYMHRVRHRQMQIADFDPIQQEESVKDPLSTMGHNENMEPVLISSRKSIEDIRTELMEKFGY